MNFNKEIKKITDLVAHEFKQVPFVSRTNENRLNAIGNIYMIYSNKELMYIGQRQAKGLKTRLAQHLYGKSYSVDENNIQNGTISKWNLVLQEINKGNEITSKAVLIEPDTLRRTIELELIKIFKPKWNIQGK